MRVAVRHWWRAQVTGRVCTTCGQTETRWLDGDVWKVRTERDGRVVADVPQTRHVSGRCPGKREVAP